MISGLFGIEGRYPFLDSELVQEFLSITSKLKNYKYKNCIANFLDIENYPYEENVKIGFGANKASKIIYVKRKSRNFLRYLIMNVWHIIPTTNLGGIEVFARSLITELPNESKTYFFFQRVILMEIMLKILNYLQI